MSLLSTYQQMSLELLLTRRNPSSHPLTSSGTSMMSTDLTSMETSLADSSLKMARESNTPRLEWKSTHSEQRRVSSLLTLDATTQSGRVVKSR